jgi:hypothetical protein
MRSSPAQSTSVELNDGEGVALLVQEAALKFKEALGPVHREGGGVRSLGTNGVVEIEARRSSGGLLEMDKRRRCGRDAMGGSIYSRALHGAMRARRWR